VVYPPNLTERGYLAACLAELLAKYRPMATKYQYPVTNSSLANEGLALINLAEEMIAYFAGTGGSGGSGPPVVTSVTVLPTLPSLTSLGATQQFTAVVLDQNLNVLTPGAGGVPALVWASSNTTAATVNSTGLATEVGNGQTIISATCGIRGGGTTLTCSGAVTLVPTTVTISPATASLTASGAQQQYTAVVRDQSSNIMTPGVGGVPPLVWSSLSPGTATINSSTGLATEVGNGTATIKCTCASAGNTATLTCSGVPGGVMPGANMPGGMTVVVNTGSLVSPIPPSAQIGGGVLSITGPTGLTLQLTNNAPSTPDGNGFWSGNLVTPTITNSGFGIQFQGAGSAHPLVGGAEPVRLSSNNFGTFGTGNIYIAFRHCFDPNWSYSQALGLKLMNPITVAGGNNDIVNVAANSLNGQVATGFGFPNWLLQGNAVGAVPSGQNTNGLPPSFEPGPPQYGANVAVANLNSAANQGRFHTLEFYLQQETVNGSSGDANCTIWVDGVKVYTTVGIAGTHFNLFASTGWKGFVIGNDYGGDQPTDHPPQTEQTAYDNILIAVS
jgi:hypothetical protein